MNEIVKQYPMVSNIVLVAILIYLVIIVIRFIGFDKLREIAYQGFLEAEKSFKHGENQAKFEYVVGLVRSAVPMYLAPFITEELLRKLIQLWFNLCKDLLNYNNAKEE